MCARGEEWSRNKWREEEVRRRTEVDILAYGRNLVAVSEFNYLGQGSDDVG